MKRSKLVVSVLAAALFTTAALGLAACSKDPAGSGAGTGTGGGGGGGGGNTDKVYTIMFDANGGTLAGEKTQKTKSDGTLASLPTETRLSYEGHNFLGWYTAKADGAGTKVTTSYKFSGPTANPITVYAHWESTGGGLENGFTITFHANNGTDTKQQFTTGANGKLTGTAPVFTYAGNEFDGWYDAANGGTAVSFDQTFTANRDVYAHWKPEQGTNREIQFSHQYSAAFKFDSGETIVISYADALPSWADKEAPFVHFWKDGTEWEFDFTLDQSTHDVGANLSDVTFMVAFKETKNDWTSWKKTDNQNGSSFADGKEYVYDAQADAEGNMNWVEGEDGVFVYVLTNKDITYK